MKRRMHCFVEFQKYGKFLFSYKV